MTNTTLTRRNVSAIARLDFTGLGHSQRIDAIGKALGFETGAALMSVLKAAESGSAKPDSMPALAASEAELPHKALILWDQSSRNAYWNGEMIDPADSTTSVAAFATQSELVAYIDGINAAQGWEEPNVVENTAWGSSTPFIDAHRENPRLTLAEWHNERMAEELEDDWEDEHGPS